MLVYVFLTHVLWFYCKLKELQKTCSMHQEEWSKRDFGGDYQPATGEAEQITQSRTDYTNSTWSLGLKKKFIKKKKMVFNG